MQGRPVSLDGESVPSSSPEVAARLFRLRWLAWLMDRSIPLGGGLRIGLDPLIGLIPGVGDWLGAVISCWLVYEAILLGVPVRVLGLMMLNILVETAIGTVPVIGDLFDAAWQANQRNFRLVERHYDVRRKRRSLRWMLAAFLVVAGVGLVATLVLIVWVIRLTWAFIA